MRTMTCRQLGGPCDLPLSADDANDVIKAQDRHLREAVASGDESHREALTTMQGRWRNPIAGMGWYRRTKREFAALPED